MLALESLDQPLFSRRAYWNQASLSRSQYISLACLIVLTSQAASLEAFRMAYSSFHFRVGGVHQGKKKDFYENHINCSSCLP